MWLEKHFNLIEKGKCLVVPFFLKQYIFFVGK